MIFLFAKLPRMQPLVLQSRHSTAHTHFSHLFVATGCLVLELAPLAAASSQGATVAAPRTGSALRTALLDATRRSVKTTSRFRVHHIRTTDRWAYLTATEVVELDEKELQETDLSVEVLLERKTAGTRWTVVELWTLPDEARRPRSAFLDRVRARQRASRIPEALFPDST